MIEIHFPEPSFRVRYKNNVPYIFDAIRRKWLLLQNEEWVRQNFVQYLIQSMHYPRPYIAIEKEIRLGQLKKRFDILVYNKQYKPWMLVECKADIVNLKEDVLSQILRYHISLPAKYLIITNGQQTYGWEKQDGNLQSIQSLPTFTLPESL